MGIMSDVTFPSLSSAPSTVVPSEEKKLNRTVSPTYKTIGSLASSGTKDAELQCRNVRAKNSAPKSLLRPVLGLLLSICSSGGKFCTRFVAGIMHFVRYLIESILAILTRLPKLIWRSAEYIIEKARMLRLLMERIVAQVIGDAIKRA
jgi:hypothetical protein